MKARRLVVLSMFVLAGCRTMPAGEVEGELQMIEEAIRARAESFNDALRTGDAELIVLLYAPEAYLLLPDTTNLLKEDLLEFFTDFLKLNPAVRTVTEHLSLSSSLEMAWEVGQYSQEYDTPTSRVVSRSSYITVWQKIGGTWKMGAQAFVPSGVPPEEVLPFAPAEEDALGQGLPNSSTAVILPDVGVEP